MARVVFSSMSAMALRAGSCLAIWARQALATSTGENFLLAKPFASLAADFQFRSWGMDFTSKPPEKQDFLS